MLARQIGWMRKSILSTLLLALLGACRQGEPGMLEKVPVVQPLGTREATPKEVDRIKDLIFSLEKIDSPDVGLCATMSGHGFSPLGKQEFGGGILMNHGLQANESLRELVELGPKALPYIVEALGDATPTKLVMEHAGGFGGMWYGKELDGNPANPKEWALVQPFVKDDLSFGATIRRHAVTVGDVCFVVLGQIVGRRYSAIRYQPTACTVVNSPTADPKIREVLRGVWATRDPAKALLDSLVLDLFTTSSEGLQGGYGSSRLQCGAAMRLLFYYPDESASLIASRLDRLDVMKGHDWSDVHPTEFVSSVAWSPNSAVRDAVVRVMNRTDNDATFRACIPAARGKDDPPIFERLKTILEGLPAEEHTYAEGYRTLMVLAERFPDYAKPLFAKYLKDAGIQRIETMAYVLRQAGGEWAVELLTPLLVDTREVRLGYGVEESSPLSKLRSRACDQAAETIHANNPELTFRVEGDRANLDRQIDAMRKAIAARQKK